MRLSINAKLIASGVILAAIASGFSFEMYRGTGVLGQTMRSVFEEGVDPLRDVDAAFARVQRLQDRIVADTADAGAPLANDGALQTRVLDDLSEALGALRQAGARIDQPDLTSKLQQIDAAISRLRATEGEVTRRFLRRELSVTLADIEGVTQSLQQAIVALREDTQTQSRRLTDLNWLSLVVLLGAGALLAVYLGWSIASPIRRAAMTLRDVGGEDEAQPKRRPRNALDELANAVAFVEALVVQRADAAQQRDTDRQERAEHEIASQRRRFDAALDRMSQAYCLLDRAGDLQSANEAFYGLFPGVARKATAALLAVDPDLGPLLEGTTSRENPRTLAGGRSIYLLRHRAARTDDEILVFEDVTDRETARQAMERLESEDKLTSLPNRPAFVSRVETLIEGGERFALVAIDIEGFRNINTTLGHGAGDEVLRKVGQRIVAASGTDAFVARLGADEFGIALSRQVDATSAERLTRAIVGDFHEKPVIVAGRPLSVRIAAGVVPVGMRSERTEALDAHGAMQDCEVALHRARGDGMAQLQVFAPELRAEMEARRRLVADLHDALARNEFELFFQPIVDCRRKTVSSFEGLARWRHPQRGLVSPAEFIPVMEEAGMIGALGRFVLREGCRQAARWPSDLSISLNLSPLQFKSPTLLDDVRGALSSSGLAPDRLHLEVTESLFLDDAESVLQTLQSLRKMGLLVSMDDFGTGYSSLGYLSRFPFDKIKIDQSFVRDMARPENIAIVRAVMGLGSAMRMTVVAEGVETVEQMEQLEREGCREMQGFLFSRPRPAGDLPKMLMEIRTRFRSNGYGTVRADNDEKRA